MVALDVDDLTLVIEHESVHGTPPKGFHPMHVQNLGKDLLYLIIEGVMAREMVGNQAPIIELLGHLTHLKQNHKLITWK